MEWFEQLYDEVENATVRFVGFTSNESRYDFGIIYTNQFFGKPLVVCMQTGKSSLMSFEDAHNLEHLQKVFNIKSLEEADYVSIFFQKYLPTLPLQPQY